MPGTGRGQNGHFLHFLMFCSKQRLAQRPAADERHLGCFCQLRRLRGLLQLLHQCIDCRIGLGD